jgi:hypothetical protein
MSMEQMQQGVFNLKLKVLIVDKYLVFLKTNIGATFITEEANKNEKHASLLHYWPAL